MKLHVKKGDTVKVIAGNSKGNTGKVLLVYPDKNRAIVEGLNKVKKHQKPQAKNTQGGIIEKESPIHISNLMLIDTKGNVTRIGRKVDIKTKKLVRYSKKSGEVIK
ncbi:MAG: 50S ribosomal protein L24 [Bacteroidales bacterium]|nr:50S ribosomal protein L24 [Bacteroidales bacterium]